MAETFPKEMTFWEHLEELRKVLFRILGVAAVAAVGAFACSSWLFKIVLAPSESDFVLYRAFTWIGGWLNIPSICPEPFQIQLISTELTSQFMIDMSVALYAGVLVISPYILYELFHFISPALYANEKRYSVRLVGYSYLLFMVGVLLNYFLIFPLTFRFLATYQVSEKVTSIITLSSYIDTLLMLTLMMGVVFEIPVLSWMLAKLHLLTSNFMRQHRKHAIVVVLVVAAIITPTSDIFTLSIVSIPIYLLYEASIGVVKRVERG